MCVLLHEIFGTFQRKTETENHFALDKMRAKNKCTSFLRIVESDRLHKIRRSVQMY